MPRQKTDHVDSAAALATRLRDARVLAGMSQRALARDICTPAYISRLEKGERIPSLQLLRQLADRLNADADELACGVPSGARDPLVDAELAMRLGETDEARQIFREALERGDRGSRARALAGLGQLAFQAGEHREAITLLEDALAARPSSPSTRTALADTLGRAYAMVGELESSIVIFQRALTEASETGDVMETLRFSVLLANAFIDAGDFGKASVLLSESLAATADAHDPILQARLWWSQSRLHKKQGDTDTAARYARRAVETLDLTEHVAYAARAHQMLAHIELDRGNAEEALELIESAYPLIERSGNRYDRGMFRLEAARALAQLGRREEAGAYAMEASGLVGDASPSDAGRAYALMADVFAGLGDRARALELYELADETLPADSRVRRDVAPRHAELLEQEGRKDDALELLKRAMKVQTESHAPIR
jgi:tetratricopeptide (TPR) repeat protein